jgi:hypothetical protein
MKRLYLCVAYLFLLQACASYSPYQPANHSAYGYSQTQLSDTQYRVDFKARDLEKGKAIDYAMLRAAELTIEKGYDWFEIVDRQTDETHKNMPSSTSFGASQNRTIERDCGLLGCRTRMSEPYNSVIIGAGVGDRDRSDVDVMLEIKMGKGVRPDVKQVYAVNTLVKNLRQSLGL